MKVKSLGSVVCLFIFSVINLSSVNALSIACNNDEPGKLITQAIKDDRYVVEGLVTSADALSSTDINSGPQDNNVQVQMKVAKVYRNQKEDPIYMNDEIEFRGTRDTWAAEYGTGPFQPEVNYIVVLENGENGLSLTSHDLYCGIDTSVINSDYSTALKADFFEGIEEYPEIFTSENTARPVSGDDRLVLGLITGSVTTVLVIGLLAFGLTQTGKIEVKRIKQLTLNIE